MKSTKSIVQLKLKSKNGSPSLTNESLQAKYQSTNSTKSIAQLRLESNNKSSSFTNESLQAIYQLLQKRIKNVYKQLHTVLLQLDKEEVVSKSLNEKLPAQEDAKQLMNEVLDLIQKQEGPIVERIEIVNELFRVMTSFFNI